MGVGTGGIRNRTIDEGNREGWMTSIPYGTRNDKECDLAFEVFPSREVTNQVTPWDGVLSSTVYHP